MASRDWLSLSQARRIALAAQGFADPRPAGAVDRRHFRGVLRRLGVVQLDSVNVVTRAHELAFFARLGPYTRAALHRYLWESGEVFEYWGHEASVLPVDLYPFFRWRMAGGYRWAGMRRAMNEHRALAERLRLEVLERGPVAAGELAPPDRRASELAPGDHSATSWWGWGPAKLALEGLFWSGEVTTVRRPTFERLYVSPARVLPAEILAVPGLEREPAWRALLLRAAKAHGVGTARDLADYFRLPVREAATTVAAMAADGELTTVSVEGWRQPAYLHPEARLPRHVAGKALLSPFDSVVWERQRTERLFGFHYRVEIYTPASKRVYGYYVLPFVFEERIAARVDVKADRQAGALRLRAAFLEDGHDAEAIAAALASEARLMADWLELPDVIVEDRGDLAPALRASMKQ
jgi:uncharacterized protein YcaQ